MEASRASSRTAVDVVREALELIARGESPAHLQAPDFRIFGGAIGVQTPAGGWGAARANDNLDTHELRTRILAIEPIDDARVYVEAAMVMRSERSPERSGQLVGAVYTVRDGLIARVDLSPDTATLRREAGLPAARG